MKLNVDSTKIIQLGITLTNEKGEYPQNLPYHTWQFNFKFDLKNDKFSEESINLLKSSGINFENLEKNGINQKKFVKELMNSALVLNPKVKWVSYHGAYDFAYLLKLLNRDILPNTEQEFIETLKVFIPEFFDIKMLIKDIDMYFNGGLNRLIYNLDIKRKGINHQAGSDSIATIESFHKLIKNESITQIKMEGYKNVLYGIGLGKDNKNTIKYINNKCNNIVNNLNVNNVNEQKINNNTVFNRNMMYFNNQSINQIKQINNACNNYMKCFYPCFLVNTFNAVKNNFYQMNFSRTMMA
jgi:CCR4-NOT transcription complex subunit 7/8